MVVHALSPMREKSGRWRRRQRISIIFLLAFLARRTVACMMNIMRAPVMSWQSPNLASRTEMETRSYQFGQKSAMVMVGRCKDDDGRRRQNLGARGTGSMSLGGGWYCSYSGLRALICSTICTLIARSLLIAIRPLYAATSITLSSRQVSATDVPASKHENTLCQLTGFLVGGRGRNTRASDARVQLTYSQPMVRPMECMSTALARRPS